MTIILYFATGSWVLINWSISWKWQIREITASDRYPLVILCCPTKVRPVKLLVKVLQGREYGFLSLSEEISSDHLQVDKISSKFILCDHVHNSHDHSVLQSIDITRRNFLLITLRALRVSSPQFLMATLIKPNFYHHTNPAITTFISSHSYKKVIDAFSRDTIQSLVSASLCYNTTSITRISH